VIIKPNYEEMCIPVRDADNARYERMFRALYPRSEDADTRKMSALQLTVNIFGGLKKRNAGNVKLRFTRLRLNT